MIKSYELLRGDKGCVLMISRGEDAGVFLTATQDAGLAEGGRGFPALEGSWGSCWAEGENFPEQRWGEP